MFKNLLAMLPIFNLIGRDTEPFIQPTLDSGKRHVSSPRKNKTPHLKGRPAAPTVDRPGRTKQQIARAKLTVTIAKRGSTTLMDVDSKLPLAFRNANVAKRHLEATYGKGWRKIRKKHKVSLHRVVFKNRERFALAA